MSKIQKLSEKADQVLAETIANFDIELIELYATSFNSWLLKKPSVGIGIIWSNAIFECSVLSETSLFLAVHGFYEEANSILRNLLDGFLTRLYWDLINERKEIVDFVVGGRKTNDYCEWEMGTTNKYPHMSKDIWPKLLEDVHISSYDKDHNLRANIVDLLHFLNKYVHGRPTTRHYDGAFRGSTLNICFISNHFDEWFVNLKKAVRFVFALSVLRYPVLLDTIAGEKFMELEDNNIAQLRSSIQLLSERNI
jgi:hypothetical protein